MRLHSPGDPALDAGGGTHRDAHRLRRDPVLPGHRRGGQRPGGRPGHPAVVDAFGAWAERPFVAVVLIAFVACVVSVQTYIGRAIFGMARDAILPGSALLRRVDRRKVPMAAMVCSTLLARPGPGAERHGGRHADRVRQRRFLRGLSDRRRLRPLGPPRRPLGPGQGRLAPGTRGAGGERPGSRLAVVRGAQRRLAAGQPRPPDAPWFQVWAVVVVFSALAAFGLLYMVIAKPHRRIATSLSFAAPPAD